VVPVAAPPIEHGAVLIGPDGRIEAVGADQEVPRPAGVVTRSFPGAALMPGLVNAHTHLELTWLAGQVEEADFSAWIRGVRGVKAGLSAEWFAAAARQGVRDAFAAGITTVLDTGDSGAVLQALVDLGGAGVAYQEVFGPNPVQCEESLRDLRDRVRELRPLARGRVHLGVSPHAPYTVSGPLYRAVAEFAKVEGLPVAVHLAESPAETLLVADHRGPFADAWNARGIPPIARHGTLPPAARRSPVSWLDAHGVLGPGTLCIHTVQLDQADLDVLAARRAPVAHCPVSNARHGHGNAPLGRLLAAGVRVGLGTDSVISVGQLDLWAEMRAAAALAGLTPGQALALATVNGARLIGAEAEVGWLGVGAFADVIAVELAPETEGRPVEARLLAAGPGNVLATFASGRPVFGRGPA
jgi:5-methylthioadenosine/S-adenosylhomocysteine deaminase